MLDGINVVASLSVAGVETPPLAPLDIRVTCNTNGSITREQVKANSERELRWITVLDANPRKCVIVGGGPSLKGNWPEILMLIAQGADVFALNGACSFMNDRGVLPTYQVLVDPRPGNVELIGLAREYLLASQCHPSLFDAVPAHKTGLFHMVGSAMGLVNGTMIGGDVTVGLVTPNLAFTLGYREIHLYGYDSSYAEGDHHAYVQAQTDQESKTLEVFTKDHEGTPQRFVTNFAMAKQAELFPKTAALLCESGAALLVHGTGLLPAIAQSMLHNPAALAAE
jgi:hypothetical protein